MIGEYVETAALSYVIDPATGSGPEPPQRKAFIKALTGVIVGSKFYGSAGSHVGEVLELVSNGATLQSEA